MNSYKSKRLTRSVSESKVMAFVDSFDMAYSFTHDVKAILKSHTPLSMGKGSQSVFDVCTHKSTSTTKKRLMIDLQPVMDAHECYEVSEVALPKS